MSANVLIGDKEMFLCIYTDGDTRSRYQLSALSHSQALTASLRVQLTAKITLPRCPSVADLCSHAHATASASENDLNPRHGVLLPAHA